MAEWRRRNQRKKKKQGTKEERRRLSIRRLFTIFFIFVGSHHAKEEGGGTTGFCVQVRDEPIRTRLHVPQRDGVGDNEGEKVLKKQWLVTRGEGLEEGGAVLKRSPTAFILLSLIFFHVYG